MARKAKPKAKAKPALTTWMVLLANGQQVQVEADDVSVNTSLCFEVAGEISFAVAPGAWTTITRIEPTPS